MDIHSIILGVSGGAGLSIIGILIGRFLQSPQSAKVEDAAAAKLAAETKVIVADLDASHNDLLHSIVHGAMAYAEAHAPEVVAKYGTKFNAVVARVAADPRVAALNLPVSAIENAMETVFLDYFKDLGSDSKSAAPADGVGGPPSGK